jgi:hypothetical protein
MFLSGWFLAACVEARNYLKVLKGLTRVTNVQPCLATHQLMLLKAIANKRRRASHGLGLKLSLEEQFEPCWALVLRLDMGVSSY